MGKTGVVVAYVVVLAVVIIALDIMFFKHEFVARLLVNLGIALLFAGFYIRFVGRPVG